MIKFLPLDFLGASHRILLKNENAVYRLQISALVPEIFKFVKCLKYANEMSDDVIYSTQFYIMYINRAILANLWRRALKLGRLKARLHRRFLSEQLDAIFIALKLQQVSNMFETLRYRGDKSH